MGLCCIAAGAIVSSLPPTNASCILGIWLINLGYTLEIVPLVVKVAAINRLSLAAQRMKRVRLTLRTLLGSVAFISSVVTVFLAAWTVLDPPREQHEYELTDDVTDDGKYIVERTYYCTPDSELWSFAAISWFLLLLLCAAVLAFQMRNLQKDINESATLAIMIYSHCMFVLLRLGTTVLQGEVPGWLLGRLQSFIYSADTIVTVIIYFYSGLFAKLFKKRREGEVSEFDLPGSIAASVRATVQSTMRAGKPPTRTSPRATSGDSFFHATLASINDDEKESVVDSQFGEGYASTPSAGIGASRCSWQSGSEASADDNNPMGVEMAPGTSPKLKSAKSPSPSVCTTCGAACPHCKTNEVKPLLEEDEEDEDESTNENSDQVSAEMEQRGGLDPDEGMAELEEDLKDRLGRGHGKPQHFL